MPTVTTGMIRELRSRIGQDGLNRIRLVMGDFDEIARYLSVDCGWSPGESREMIPVIVDHMLDDTDGSIAPVPRAREVEW